MYLKELREWEYVTRQPQVHLTVMTTFFLFPKIGKRHQTRVSPPVKFSLNNKRNATPGLGNLYRNALC